MVVFVFLQYFYSSIIYLFVALWRYLNDNSAIKAIWMPLCGTKHFTILNKGQVLMYWNWEWDTKTQVPDSDIMALTNEMNACYTEWLLAILSAFPILAYFNWTEYHVFKKIEKTYLGVLQQGRNKEWPTALFSAFYPWDRTFALCSHVHWKGIRLGQSRC